MEEIKNMLGNRRGEDSESGTNTSSERTHQDYRKKSSQHHRNNMAKNSLNERIKRMCIVVLIGGLVGGVLIGNVFASIKTKAAVKSAETTAQAEQKELETKISALEHDLEDAKNGVTEDVSSDWNMMLVNTDHPLDESYTPENLTVVGKESDGMMVDGRIVEALNKMLDDGAAAGLGMEICSAYRDNTKQKEVFNSTMQTWIDDGYSNYDAFNETRKSVQIPGCSEHATGLAVDIISKDYTTLDEGQASTAEQKWLAANCSKYGFILRYPPDKSDITGIIYEPWHYRYVGDEAQAITDSGLTFEEYLDAKAAGTLEEATSESSSDSSTSDTSTTDKKN